MKKGLMIIGNIDITHKQWEKINKSLNEIQDVLGEGHHVTLDGSLQALFFGTMLEESSSPVTKEFIEKHKDWIKEQRLPDMELGDRLFPKSSSVRITGGFAGAMANKKAIIRGSDFIGDINKKTKNGTTKKN